MILSEVAANGPQFFYLVPWIVFFPVIGLLINLIFGGRIGEKAIGIIASLASGLAFVVAVLLVFSLIGHPEGVTVYLAEWISVGELKVAWAFRVDALSVTMMMVVAGVGTLIHIYAIGYMHEDVRFKGDPGRYQRFFVFFNLFIAAMMILVSADNYLMLFVGWEGVGLCSYLLIGFWYDKDTLGRDSDANAIAGKKAFIVNRIGDFGLLIAIFILFWVFGTLNFEVIFERAPEVAHALPGVILAVTLFMLVGVAGKSAQIPLYVWLPDAMAGPTPVSALIHAATMVTAGVYLIARSAPLYVQEPAAQSVVALVGGLTGLFAATIAVGQYDIKKVLAYSTISQLGFMVAAVGMGAFVAGIFHLVAHAFFKALLFLSAGSVILGIERGHHHLEHGHHEGDDDHEEVFDPSDMRNMGGLRKKMPVTFWVYLIGAVALAGVPPFAGFFSKDEILTEAIELNFISVDVLLALAAIFTAFYMGRQIWMVFFGKPRHEAAGHAVESPAIITVPLMILAFLSIFGGGLNIPRVHTFTHWLEHYFEEFDVHLHAAEFNYGVAISATLLALIAIFLSWLLYGRKPLTKGQPDPLKRILGPVFTVLENKYWVDELYRALFVNPYIAISRFLAETIDWRFWHDWFHDTLLARSYRHFARFLSGPVDLGVIDGIANGLADFTTASAASMRKLQTGYVRNYALSVFIGIVLIIGYLILR
ncbi:MAG: NADH-quinone oxidoreductase subunit L [Anaerolineales bacterium]|nr:NADH-quinone oxidoreductase subunit L [Anaerolineales bacterium]